MRIAFFSKHLPSDQPNGVSVQVHRIAEALSTMGHELTCFSFSPPPVGAAYRTIQFESPGRRRLASKFAPALRFRHVDTSGFDIVHYHGDDYLCRGSGRRVRTFYGTALKEALHARTPGRLAYQALFYAFELVSCWRRGTLVAISRDTMRYLPPVKTHIPCAVPLGRFRPGAPRTPYPSLLFVGDLHSRKRGEFLVQVFKRDILPRFPDCRLTIVGPEPCRGEGIEFAGRLDESRLIEAYQRSWVYCLPSSYEGFGVPVIEAMACGTAVAAIDSPALREILVNECNGLLCTTNTLPAQLTRLLADSDLRTRLSHHGLSVAAMFDSDTIARSYERLYYRSAGDSA